MQSFKELLSEKIKGSLDNQFGAENFDEYRYGNFSTATLTKKSIKDSTKNFLKKSINYEKYRVDKLEKNLLVKYGDKLENVFYHLNKESQEIFIELIAFRLLGFEKVKLSRNNTEYGNAIEKAKALGDPKDTYDPHFMDFILEKFDLTSLGYDLKLYFSNIGIAIDFIIEQYAYESSDRVVKVEAGDVVFDIGGCWADTALYFAHKTGKNGKVYSFEFIPDNIKLFNINCSFNPETSQQIQLVQHPVSNKTGEKIYFKDAGPGSRIELQPFDGQTGSTTTVSIDDFVRMKKIDRVDFIKMDIEGAEPLALKGSIETIKRFRPKLAIATYHSMEDFVSIPDWILNLDLGYEVFIDHYTIHSEETVCFAKPTTH